MKKTEPEYYPPVENLLDLIYEHYTENTPIEKNTDAGKAAKASEIRFLSGRRSWTDRERCAAHGRRPLLRKA